MLPSFMLPKDRNAFEEAFATKARLQPENNTWIVKDPKGRGGRGIYIQDDITQIDLDSYVLVSTYVKNPLLVNSFKYDLRVYVLVASLDPLVLFVYDEGLARLSANEYSFDAPLDQLYIHLNNVGFQINSKDYVENESVDEDDYGTLWTISALFWHLEQAGVDVNMIWSQIYDLVIKAIMLGEEANHDFMEEERVPQSLFLQHMGFDIILDSNFRPRLLEENCSPLLTPHSPLQATVSANLIQDVFNLVGIPKVDKS